MLRLIIRPLIFCVWLCAAAACVVLLFAGTPTASALIFMQQGSRSERLIAYYDPATRQTLRVPYASARPALATDSTVLRSSQYVTPRPTRTGIDLFIIAGVANERQLTFIDDFPPPTHQLQNRRSNVMPHWSPDGAWIAFASIDPLASMDIYIIRPDGNGLTLVASNLGTPTAITDWVHLPPRQTAPLVALLAALIAVPLVAALRRLG